MNDQTGDFADDVPPPEDPLEDLLARAAADPKEAYRPDVVAALAELRKTNRGRFVELLNDLKKIKTISIGELRAAINAASGASFDPGSGASTGSGGSEASIAEMLIALAAALYFFTAPFLGDEQKPFVDFPGAKGHCVTALVDSRAFRRWLAHQLYATEGKGASEAAMATALLTLEARAVAEGHRHEVFVRVGEHAGAVYIDLGDDSWDALEVTKSGWRVVADPPIRFARSIGALPLPRPVRGGTLEPLTDLLNVDEHGLIISTGWLVGTFNPRGPYTILVVIGQHGTAKTMLIRLLRRLIDPSRADVRTFPPSERDLLVSAQRSWVQGYDNLSSISDDQSDAMCRLSTGGSMILRSLYTNSDETVLGAQRPAALVGITEIVTRADLMDRCVFVTPKPITTYREETAIWAEMEAAAPAMLGALLDAVSASLRARDDPAPLVAPWRMVDFARWVSGAETALGWPSGTFVKEYAANRENAVRMVVEADPLATALLAFMREKIIWSGTALALHAALSGLVGGGASTAPGWPRSHGALGRALPRIIPPLFGVGLRVTTRRINIERTITLEWRDAAAPEPEAAAEPGAAEPEVDAAPDALEPDPKPTPEVAPVRADRASRYRTKI